MKKYILFLLAICFISLNPVRAQLGGLLKKATKSVSNEVLGKSDSPNPVNSEPEPNCASDQAELAFDLGGKLHLLYSEVGLMVKDDGSLLLKDNVGGNYYLAKDGVTQGPFKEGDPKIAGFDQPKDDNQGEDDLLIKYKQYISKSGDKYLITFDGKSYGPYATISSFIVSKAKTKFAALATKNVMLTEDEGKKLEAEIKNAKTQQEQAEIAQKYAQKMQENMMAGGSNETTGPELVTNIPDSHYDLIEYGGGNLTADIKYDDILIHAPQTIYDLHGNTLFNIDHDLYGSTDLFVSSDNKRLAGFNFGTLTFNDKKTLSGMSKPHLIKVNGQVYLAYLYYSPKRNAIMQNKIAF
jgi:hypothetical protein